MTEVDADIESRARRIAARKMGLQKDFYGRNLPADLWQQAIPDAKREADEDAKFRYANRIQI
jgi:hypothetical protein